MANFRGFAQGLDAGSLVVARGLAAGEASKRTGLAREQLDMTKLDTQRSLTQEAMANLAANVAETAKAANEAREAQGLPVLSTEEFTKTFQKQIELGIVLANQNLKAGGQTGPDMWRTTLQSIMNQPTQKMLEERKAKAEAAGSVAGAGELSKTIGPEAASMTIPGVKETAQLKIQEQQLANEQTRILLQKRQLDISERSMLLSAAAQRAEQEKPGSPIGKMIRDYQNIVASQGEDSEAAKYMKDAMLAEVTPDDGATIENVFKLRNDYTKQSSETIGMATQYRKVQAAAEGGDTPANNMALVFSFMKLLDPTSVVRESEYATAENARGVPDAIRNTWNKLIDGNRLTKKQREDFLAASKRQMAGVMNSQSEIDKEFMRLAEGERVNPNRVIWDVTQGLTKEFSGTDKEDKLVSTAKDGTKVFVRSDGTFYEVSPDEK